MSYGSRPTPKQAEAGTTTRRRSRASAAKRAGGKTFTIHLVSDATGNLASHMVNTTLTQFPTLKLKKVYHNFQDDAEDVQNTIKSLRRRSNHVVLHALTNPESKAALRNACAERDIPHFDLTGSLVQFISDHTRQAPLNEKARLHQTDAGYFQRIDAMEFTAQHDDSRRLGTISQADIVIVGLSRVGKSPTSTFLGSMGWRVANVSISRETGFPSELKRVKKKTVALTLRPRDLHKVRQNRFSRYSEEIEKKGAADLPYYDLRSIISEVVYAEREFKKRGYPIIDTTQQTVEETAALILRTLNLKRKDFEYR